MKKIGSCQSAQCDIGAEGVCQVKLRRFTDAGVAKTRAYLAAVKESNDVENVTLNGQPFTRATKMSHHW